MDIESFIEGVVSNTFRHDLNKLHNRLLDLINRNGNAVAHGYSGFLYGGRFWTNIPKSSLKGVTKRPPHNALIPEISQFTTDVKKTEQDQQQLIQKLRTLLRDCTTYQDLRDAMPEAALDFMPDSIAKIPRTRDEGYPLKDRLMGPTDFQKTVDVFLFYLANRMIT